MYRSCLSFRAMLLARLISFWPVTVMPVSVACAGQALVRTCRQAQCRQMRRRWSWHARGRSEPALQGPGRHLAARRPRPRCVLGALLPPRLLVLAQLIPQALLGLAERVALHLGLLGPRLQQSASARPRRARAQQHLQAGRAAGAHRLAGAGAGCLRGKLRSVWLRGWRGLGLGLRLCAGKEALGSGVCRGGRCWWRAGLRGVGLPGRCESASAEPPKPREQAFSAVPGLLCSLFGRAVQGRGQAQSDCPAAPVQPPPGGCPATERTSARASCVSAWGLGRGRRPQVGRRLLRGGLLILLCGRLLQQLRQLLGRLLLAAALHHHTAGCLGGPTQRVPEPTKHMQLAGTSTAWEPPLVAGAMRHSCISACASLASRPALFGQAHLDSSQKGAHDDAVEAQQLLDVLRGSPGVAAGLVAVLVDVALEDLEHRGGHGILQAALS